MTRPGVRLSGKAMTMVTERFVKKLNEALATIGGVRPPVTFDNGKDNNDDDWQPDRRDLRMLYDWIARANRSILTDIVHALEQVEPKMHVGLVRVTGPAGNGTPMFSGEALLTAAWSVREGDRGWPMLESALRTTLLKSDLWKSLGVDYKKATSYLDNHQFQQNALAALALKLTDDNHSAYWLHLLSGKTLTIATAQINAYLIKSSDMIAHNNGHKVKPNSVKVTPTGNPVNAMKGRVPAPGELFHISAQTRYSFTGQIELGGDGIGLFNNLPESTQSDILHSLTEAIEVAWDDNLYGKLEVELNPSGGGRGGYWEPSVGRDVDPSWTPDKLEHTIKNWRELFEDVDLSYEQLSAVLNDLPRSATRLIRTQVDCNRSVIDSDDFECTATLTLESASLDAGGLFVRIKIVDITAQ